ncbi:DUF1573 domain-containing protein [Gimesia benthica]|uniref:DUF1573 domain-containing protein n=1 Tax=Gimesia benthica TaxID=2608982 RepID=A0A6I6AKL3_9PLAN|nr:DUF1573 domain-containing protein [Gimesia benthica]QGQ25631.1 DUF1573 domain-containing protein [Gimesia benthica]
MTSQQSVYRQERFKGLFILYGTCLWLVQLVGCGEIKESQSLSQKQQLVVLTHDFGVVSPGQLVEHEFIIKNEEIQEVEYTKYNIGCPCVTIVSNSGPIPINGEGVIKLKMETRGIKGFVKRNAMLLSPDSKVKPVVLELTGTVANIWPSSKTIELGNLMTGSSTSRSFLVIATGYTNAKIKSVSVQNPVIQTKIEDVVPDTVSRARGLSPIGQVKLEWDGQPLPPGPFETTITITTNVPEFATIQVPVVGYASGSIKVSPASLLFGNVSAGDHVRRSCKLIGPIKWAEVQSLQLKADHDFVEGAFSRASNVETGQLVLDVDLSIPEMSKKGLIKGDLLVSKQNGKFSFSVPYIAFVK